MHRELVKSLREFVGSHRVSFRNGRELVGKRRELVGE